MSEQGPLPHEALLQDWYERFGPHLYRRCVSILGDDELAWDALQDSFVQAARNMDRFEARSQPSTWLYRICTNVCLNMLRRRKVRDVKHRQSPGAVDHRAAPRPRADDAAEATALVRALLHHFDERTQACAIHFWVDEMSKAEVARVTGLSVPTVRKYLRNFRERARALVEES